MDPTHDLENAKKKRTDESSSEIVVVESGDDNKKLPVWKWLAKWGVEVRGIDPVPPEERTKTEYSSIFFMWISILCNLLP